MTVTSWALACMWMSLGQAPSDVFVIPQRSLSIPITIKEPRRAELRELLLYASKDQGRNWQQVGSILPTQNGFTYNADSDGSYWFRVAVINRLGKQEPDNIYQGPPDQKIVIDTAKPLLRMRPPERNGDEVILAWELQEENPEWTTFRLEYQVKDGGPAWLPIPATPGLTGQARFRPKTAAPISVRLSFGDQAGNQAFAQADLNGTITTAAYPNPSGTGAIVQTQAPALPGQLVLPPPPTAPALSENVPPPPAPELPRAVPTTEKPVRTFPPLVESPKTFPPSPAAPVAVSAPWNAPQMKAETDKVVATSQAAPLPTPAPVAPPTPQRNLPPLQYVNHPEVTLEYELARVGPSGVGSVDLWWTKNDGQTWEHYAVDPESKSGVVTNGRHKRTVYLQEGDGGYGFALVVKSRAGLGKAPPRAGDSPDIRIELDTTAPDAKLFAPQPDNQKPNTLLLKWIAQDSNLSNTPILLEWSARREGPWTPITSSPLPNTGRHSWTLPEGLPVQVYLRLRVRDMAGNESVAVTADPQLVDLSEPEGRLVNVSVSPR